MLWQEGFHLPDALPCQVQQEASKASGQGLAWRIKSQLTGVKTVVVSAPGVLLEEWSPEQLQVQRISGLGFALLHPNAKVPSTAIYFKGL